MTETKQDKLVEAAPIELTETVELSDAALDDAAGGTFYGSGVYKSQDSGRTWTL